MTRWLFVAVIITMSPVFAQEAPAPETCLATADSQPSVTVTHAGKEYRLTSESCREQFLSDPERYAQLYDALSELAEEGVPLEPPPASLVPS